MKMVSAAKLRRAQDAIVQMRPYAQKLDGIVANISAGANEETEHVLLKERPVGRILVVVVTSDRGLCGAFNSNVSKQTLSFLKENFAPLLEKDAIHFLALGKKGGEFFAKKGYRVLTEFVGIFQQLSFNQSRRVSAYISDQFVSGTYDRVYVVYNEFKNVATQIVRMEQLLPVPQAALSTASTTFRNDTDYLFEPGKEAIFEDIIPKMLNVKLYKAILESNASEHGARMTGMDKATENAGELLKDLRLTYNRSRQAAITKEILEIVGGAEALSNA
jgi:F-type H+-transporting ATPase subunit gamma